VKFPHNCLNLPPIFPQGLKPRRIGICGTAEQLAEKVADDTKAIPRRLKPNSFRGLYGPAKARPFQRIEFFRTL
jgi:hypothetical protein